MNSDQFINTVLCSTWRRVRTSNHSISTFIHRERKYVHPPQPSEYSPQVKGAELEAQDYI